MFSILFVIKYTLPPSSSESVSATRIPKRSKETSSRAAKGSGSSSNGPSLTALKITLMVTGSDSCAPPSPERPRSLMLRVTDARPAVLRAFESLSGVKLSSSRALFNS